ncbi:MAG: hypothetical protein IJ644_06840 [Oscillospiraceae bacterium]|nr:hypothetical protein [Oscillospiraceae bacterium]
MGLFRKKKKHPYYGLNIGLVGENFVIADKADLPLWESRGFQVIRHYMPYAGYWLKPSETVMLGKPMKISEFGTEQFIGSRILDYNLCFGTYGMGGAGFFGLKLEGEFGIRWLVYCIWSAGEHVLIDDRIIECHPAFLETYHPWLVWGNNMDEEYEQTYQNLKSLLSGLEILNIDLQEHALKIQLSGNHILETYQKSDKFPEQGGTRKKRLSYKTGTMSDCWLVIYDNTDLTV